MLREIWWAGDVPPPDFGERRKSLMRWYGGFMLIVGLAVGIGIGFLVWGPR